MRLHSSVARVGEAKAALYPRIILTADRRHQDRPSCPTCSPAAPTSGRLAGNLFMPLINRGATQAQIKAAEARVGAGHGRLPPVDPAGLRRGRERPGPGSLPGPAGRATSTDSAEQARRSVDLAQDRYRRGLDSLLVTLESQRRLFNAESQLLTTQTARRAGPRQPDPGPGRPLGNRSRHHRHSA